MASTLDDTQRASSSAWLKVARRNQLQSGDSEVSTVHTTKSIEDVVPGGDVAIGVVAPLCTFLEDNDVLSFHRIWIRYYDNWSGHCAVNFKRGDA